MRPLAAGTWDVSASATDVASNVGTDGTSGELVIDLTPPPAPAVDAMAPTPDTTPLVTGTATMAPGDRLDVTIGGVTYSDVTVTGGAWSVQVTSALSDGTHEVVATVTDAAGNSTSDATSGELVIDGSIGVSLFGTAAGQEDLVGGVGSDTIGGLEQGSTQSGAGTVDTLTGGQGDDTFILGTASTRYYDDGNPNAGNNGRNDYALITDFGIGGDRIELHGTGYIFADYSLNGVTGTGIFHDANGNGFDSKDELIGLLQDISPSEVQASVEGGLTVLTKAGGITGVTVFGTAGDDVFDAGPYNDVIYGGGGNDIAQIVGADMADAFHGGAGSDTLDLSLAAGGGGVDVDLGAGSYVWGAGSPFVLTSVENAVGTGADDTLVGSSADNTLEGGAGADVLNGGAGIDTASYASATSAIRVNLKNGNGTRGDADGDSLISIENVLGSAYDDVLIGDNAANLLMGGDGIDVLQGGAGADTLDGGDGLDWAAYFDATGPLVIDLATPSNSSAFFAEDTLINIEIIGGATNFANTFRGDANANIFIGGAMADSIDGGGGADLLQGGDGADTIVADAGTDAVMGGRGDDILYGGGDADGFYFQDGDGIDVVKDFDLVADKLVFIGVGLNQLTDLQFGENEVGDAVISYGTSSIVLEGIAQSEVDGNDSLFLWY